MILLSRSEVFAKQKGFFSEMQFSFQEGKGCIEASFTIFGTSNHMLERGCKISAAFLMFLKLLMQYGLTAYYTSYLLSWGLEAECG